MYRQSDIVEIKSNMDNIKDEAMKRKLEVLEPTLKEYKEVYDVILDFVKRKKKIVYGGYAQNRLIALKNPNDVFYRELDLADIEFYSHEPINDIIELCDILQEKNYKYVQGSEGVHPETYKVFVNFINYCDVSYAPKNVQDNIPYIEDRGIKYTHPHFMLVDAFRVYADPLTSYFRLDKTFNRFTTLMKYYPFDKSFEKNNPVYNLNNDMIKRFVRHNILHGSQLIVIGHYAYNYLVKKVNLGLEFDNFTYYQAISINYEEDKTNIENYLKDNFNNDITSKDFTPYFQFYDKHTEYYYKNVCVLKIYGHNNRCIVNTFSERKKVFFGTYQAIFLYLLIDYQYAITRRDNVEKNNYMTMITRLLKAREHYLDKHEISVLDKSPFQEFTLQCLGSTEDPLRMGMIESRRRKDAHKQIKFRYDPQPGKPGKVPRFNFENTSGNVIMNK